VREATSEPLGTNLFGMRRLRQVLGEHVSRRARCGDSQRLVSSFSHFEADQDGADRALEETGHNETYPL